MKQSVIIGVASLALLAVPALHAQPTESSVSIQPSDIKWAPFTAPGIEIAWMRGGPKASGPYAFRLKMVPGSHSAAHFHPDERSERVDHALLGTGPYRRGGLAPSLRAPGPHGHGSRHTGGRAAAQGDAPDDGIGT